MRLYNLFDTDHNLIFKLEMEDEHIGPKTAAKYFIEQVIAAKVDLSHASLHNMYFYQINFQGVSLKYADLRGSYFEYCDLSGVDVSQAQLKNVNIPYDRNKVDGLMLPEELIPQEGDLTLYKIVRIDDDTALHFGMSNRYAVLELFVPDYAQRMVANAAIPRYRVDRAVPVKLFDLDGNPLNEGIKICRPPVQGFPVYELNKMYLAHDLNMNIWDSCSWGINCFDTFEKAVEYYKTEL